MAGLMYLTLKAAARSTWRPNTEASKSAKLYSIKTLSSIARAKQDGQGEQFGSFCYYLALRIGIFIVFPNKGIGI